MRLKGIFVLSIILMFTFVNQGFASDASSKLVILYTGNTNGSVEPHG